MNNIGFRDRILNTWERSHYYCKRCLTDLHPDTMNQHICPDKLPINQMDTSVLNITKVIN